MPDRDDGTSLDPAHPGGDALTCSRIGRGPRIVWLHGGPGLDHHSLLPIARRLADAYESWLPDLPGHGVLEAPPQLPGLVEIRDRLHRWLASLDPAPDVLIGHSLGAWFAREALRTGRVLPRAAVLLSPPAGGRRQDSTPIRKVEERFATRFPAARVDELREGPREFLAFLEADPPGIVSEAFAADLANATIRPAWRYSTLLRQWHRALRRPMPSFEAPCPTLVACGRLDRVTPPAEAQAVHRVTKGSELLLIDGVGHVPWSADPGPVAQPLEEFLRRALGGPSRSRQRSSPRRRRTK